MNPPLKTRRNTLMNLRALSYLEPASQLFQAQLLPSLNRFIPFLPGPQLEMCK